MAGPDLSIYQQYMRPVKSVADYGAEADAQEQNRLALLLQRGQADDRQRARDEQQRLMRTLQGLPAGADDNAVADTLQRGGFLGQANDYRDKAIKRQEIAADIAKKKGEAETGAFKVANDRYNAFKTITGRLRGVPGLNKGTVAEVLNEAVQAGVLPDEFVQGALQRMPDDPAQVAQRVEMAFRQQLTPEQVLTAFAPKPEFKDDGKRITAIDTNPNSPTYGQPTAGAPIVKTTTPGEDLSSADRAAALRQQAAEAAAGRAVTVRGQNMTNERADQANRLKALEITGAAESGAAVLGVPRPAVLPWTNQSNPKDANKVKANEFSRGSKEIEKDVDAARKEQDTARQAARFIELNKKVGTGGLVDRIGVTRAVQGMGAEYSEMEAITARLAPAMREPGSGSTSDFDGKQFERATVGVDKPQKTNENIARGMIARAQQAQDYADFRNTYLEQNGTLAGADRYWKEYADKNPIFNPTKPGTFELNPDRKPWRDHFKATAPAAAAPGRDILSEADAILNGVRGGKR